MSFPRNPNSYTDVVPVLQAARAQGGAIYTLTSPGEAVRWRAKAFFYRTLLAQIATARSGNPPGFFPSTLWDDMVLTIIGNTVKIEFTGGSIGKLTSLSGEPVPVTPHTPVGEAEQIIRSGQSATEAAPVPLDDLEEQAQALLKKIG